MNVLCSKVSTRFHQQTPANQETDTKIDQWKTLIYNQRRIIYLETIETFCKNIHFSNFDLKLIISGK